MAVTVWTPARKWIGNLLPAAFWLPCVAYGLFRMVRAGQITADGVWWIVIGTGAGWLALNWFGLFQNRTMKLELSRLLGATDPLPEDRTFVGFASPKYTGLLDAHEDVGFLCFLDDSLVFVSQSRMIDLPRASVRSVRFRPNVHSIVGLGRWISVEAEAGGKPLRLLVEPRESPTMLGNLLRGSALGHKISNWASAKSDAGKPSSGASLQSQPLRPTN